MPVFRDGTWDANIWASVVLLGEYPLPATFEERDVVIDIGSHVGAFSYACLMRGAGRVNAFEADRANYGLTVANTALFGDRCRVYQEAVWRSDRLPTVLHHSGYGDARTGAFNTGGGNVLFSSDGQEVGTVALDNILTAGRVRLLKLDCEGSEFPILLTSKRLRQVEEIVGEFHEMGGDWDDHEIPLMALVGGYAAYTMPVLEEFLRSQGFEVTWTRSVTAQGPCNLGKFRGVRIGMGPR